MTENTMEIYGQEPAVLIVRLHDEEGIVGGSEAVYSIKVSQQAVDTFDIGCIKLCGSLSESAELTITGSGTNYQAVVKLPEEPGTIGLFAENERMARSAAAYSSDVSAAAEIVVTMDKTSERGEKGNDARITFVVGVPDAFYIKSYSFTLNGVLQSKRGTNEFTYKNLSNDKLYTLGCDLEVYTTKDKDTIVKKHVQKTNVNIPASMKSHMMDLHMINVNGFKPNGDKEAGDSIFIKTKNGKTVLIDTGSSYGAGKIDTYLRNVVGLKPVNGVITIDYFFNTHPHHDHESGFAGLTGYKWSDTQNKVIYSQTNLANKNVRYQFTNIVLSKNYREPLMQQSSWAKNVIFYAENVGKLITVCAGNYLACDGLIFNIFSPYKADAVPLQWLSNPSDNEPNYTYIRQAVGKDTPSDGTSSLNNQSIVMKVICGGRKFLLMGDAEFFTEELLLGKAADTSDWNVTVSSTVNKINLARDLAKANNITADVAVSNFQLKRFTKKDLDAVVLKKGHHGTANNMSIDFLNAVKASKFCVSAHVYGGDNPMASTPVSTARNYFTSLGHKTDMENWNKTWQSYVFSTGKHGQSGGFFIRTYGRKCDFSDPYSKKQY